MEESVVMFGATMSLSEVSFPVVGKVILQFYELKLLSFSVGRVCYIVIFPYDTSPVEFASM